MFAFAAFGCTLPHFMFGDELLRANNAFYGGETSEVLFSDVSTSMALRNSSDPLDQPVVSGVNLCRTASANSSFGSNGKCPPVGIASHFNDSLLANLQRARRKRCSSKRRTRRSATSCSASSS